MFFFLLISQRMRLKAALTIALGAGGGAFALQEWNLPRLLEMGGRRRRAPGFSRPMTPGGGKRLLGAETKGGEGPSRAPAGDAPALEKPSLSSWARGWTSTGRTAAGTRLPAVRSLPTSPPIPPLQVWQSAHCVKRTHDQDPASPLSLLGICGPYQMSQNRQ